MFMLPVFNAERRNNNTENKQRTEWVTKSFILYLSFIVCVCVCVCVCLEISSSRSG